MSIADIKLKELMKEVIEEGVYDKDPRTVWSDTKEKAHTKFITQYVERFNIAKGEYPITEIKPTAWKTGIRELFAIYQNQSNKLSEFERLGVKWWEPWRWQNVPHSHNFLVEDLDDTIGMSYPYNLESHRNAPRSIVKIKERKVDIECAEPIDLSHLGDEYVPTVNDIGYIGNPCYNNFTVEEIDYLKALWMDMIYMHDPDEIFVHQEWHCFADFLRDVRYIPQYFLAKEDNFKGWVLTTNYYNSNAFSKDTCVFLKEDEALSYTEVEHAYQLKDLTTDKIKYYLFLDEIARDLELPIDLVLNIYLHDHERYLIDDIFQEDCLYRYELSRNQVIELINDIKNHPYHRRHIISLWNFSNMNKKSLVECAFETHWSVRGKYLDLTLVQRSQDILGANNINNLQYVAFLQMICRVTGYKPGKYMHIIINAHLYDRHIEIAEEFLERPVRDNQPKLIFKPKTDDFFSFTIDDFRVEDYEPQEKRFIPIAE